MSANDTTASAGPGWFGIQRQVLHFLRTVGADRDPTGNFLIGGTQVISGFMGLDEGENTEVVIPTETYYLSNGRQCNLAAGLRSTSYGTAVYVIA